MGAHVKIAPRGYWARSVKARVAWAINRTLARLEKKAQGKPIAVHQARVELAFVRAFGGVNWERWARENTTPEGGRLVLKPGASFPDLDFPALDVAVQGLATDAAREGWERGRKTLPRTRKAAWGEKKDRDKPRGGKRKPQRTGFVETPGIREADEIFLPLPAPELDRAVAGSMKLVAGMKRTAREQMRAMMVRTMESGETFEAFARDLRREFPVLARARALTIAVTEYARVASGATREAYRAAGVTGKQWNTVDDDLVCAICAANEEQGPIPIDEEFESGDQNAPAHPKCRCNLSSAAAPGRRLIEEQTSDEEE